MVIKIARKLGRLNKQIGTLWANPGGIVTEEITIKCKKWLTWYGLGFIDWNMSKIIHEKSKTKTVEQMEKLFDKTGDFLPEDIKKTIHIKGKEYYLVEFYSVVTHYANIVCPNGDVVQVESPNGEEDDELSDHLVTIVDELKQKL